MTTSAERAMRHGIARELASDGRLLLVASCDKREHRSRYGRKSVDEYLPADVYLMLFTFVLEWFCALLEQCDGNGRVVLERRGRSEDTKLAKRFADTLVDGTRYYEGWRFADRIFPSLDFRSKQDHVGGLQLSDWILWPLSKRLAGSTQYEAEWSILRGKFWLGDDPGRPAQLGLKTWPRALGREWLGHPREET